VKIHRLFFRRIIHGELGDEKMSAEIVNLIFDCILETLHYEKRNDRRGKPNGDAGDGYLVNRRRKTLLLIEPDSFGYEIREVQLIANFCKIK
jgi:hypothetical protein